MTDAVVAERLADGTECELAEYISGVVGGYMQWLSSDFKVDQITVILSNRPMIKVTLPFSQLGNSGIPVSVLHKLADTINASSEHHKWIGDNWTFTTTTIAFDFPKDNPVLAAAIVAGVNFIFTPNGQAV